MDELELFITHYCKLNDEELNLIANKFVKKAIPKGRHILKRGQICRHLIYTIEGNFRIYYKDDSGKEITTWLVFDDMIATELASFITQQPTKFNVQAIYDSTITSISYDDLHKLYNEIPKFQEFGRKIAEEVVVGAINRVVSFQNETADKRYIKLLSRSEYLQQIPLKYVASFLGVTDTSLSRIRRKKK